MKLAKDMRKGTFLVLFLLLILFSMLTTARAANTYGLHVGGVEITSDNLTVSGGSGTATYDPETHTLTLNNYSYAGNGYTEWGEGGGIDYRGGNLRIVLQGSNSIVKSATSDPDCSHGIYFRGGTLTISGEGSLDISFQAATSGIWKRNGIFCEPGAFVMESGTVTTAGGYAKESAGIYTQDGITINGGTFTGIGNPTSAYESRGIYSHGSIRINDGTVTARATNNGYEAFAFHGGVTINGGEVTASASSDDEAKAFCDSCNVAGKLLGMKVGDSAESAVATTNPGDASGKKYVYTKVLPPVSYQDAAWNAETKTVDFTEKTCKDYTPVTSGATAWNGGTDGAWYVVNSNVTIASRITVTGDVKLILCDGATLTASEGITVNEGNSLTIYGQTNGTGALTIPTGVSLGAGIGGLSLSEGGYTTEYHSGGTIIINGGKITATGGQAGAGIGGGYGGGGGTITINGGTVEAYGCPNNSDGAGIGGGQWGSGGTITINGGTVTAQAGMGGAGIGSASASQSGQPTSVIINGGTIAATGGMGGAGIGDGGSSINIEVTIHSGTVTATGGMGGAGIGGGMASLGGTITITGGTVTATGGAVTGTSNIGVAGIGSGADTSSLTGGAGIGGGTIGIGGGGGGGSSTPSMYGNGPEITITGGTVTAIGSGGGAGIGNADSATLSIGDGITVKAGNDAASAVAVSVASFTESHTQPYAYLAYSAWADLQAKLNAGGEITLTEDVTASASDSYLEVPSGKTVTLDLNGHTIDRALTAATSDGSVIQVSGTLTVKDSGTGGKITGGHTNTHGGGVYIPDGGAFTLESGEISGNIADFHGGGVNIDDGGEFTMSGGAISGNTAKYDGGGVFIFDGAFTMYGGEISGNTADYGGGAYIDGGSGAFTLESGEISGNIANSHGGGVWNSNEFTMKGGEISGNTAAQFGGGVANNGTFTMSGGAISGNTVAQFGGGVLSNLGAFNLSGSPKITGNVTGGTITDGVLSGGTAQNVYLVSGQTITIDGTLAAASVGVTTQDAPTADSAVMITSGLSGKGAASSFVSDVGYLVKTDDSGEAYMDGSTAWADLQAKLNAGGEIKLTWDVTASASDTTALQVPSGKAVTLDLNGHTIDRALTAATSDGSVIQVSGTLTVKDSGTGGKITGGYNNLNGGGVYIYGAFTLESGAISGNTAEYDGGGVNIDDGGAFTMSGGEISGNTANYNGGGVRNYNGGTFTMSGGAISGNTAQSGGGVFNYYGSTFTMSGGEISGNTANYGGGVYNSGGTFTMKSGEISGNTAQDNGGGVYISNGTFNLSESPKITGNVKGGTITDGVLSGGTAQNVYLKSGKTITLDGTLAAAASVGVTTEDVPAADFAVTITSGLSGKGAASNFTSDSADYGVKLNSDGEAVLMAAATLTTAPAAQSLTYNGNAQALVSAGAATGGTVQYKLDDSGEYSATIPTAKDAGTYTVYYKVVGDDAHADTKEASVSVTIAPEEVTLSWANTALTYNGEAQTPTATADELIDGDICTVTVTGGQTNAGTYTATATALSNANYRLPATATAAFTIAKKEVTLSWANTALTYNGEAQTPTATAGGLIDGDTCTVTVTGGKTNAGTYTATATALSNANYQLPATATAAFTIAKAEVPVNAGMYFKPYGDPDPEFTYTVGSGESSSSVVLDDPDAGGDTSGSGSDDVPLPTKDDFIGALTRETGEDVGIYEIKQGTLALKDSWANNYEIKFTAGSLEIYPKEITDPTVTVSDNNGNGWTYTGSAIEPPVTVKDGNTAIPDTEYEVSYSDNINAGTASVTVTFHNGNYSFVDEDFNPLENVVKEFVIAQKPVTVTADDKSKAYGDADPELTATVEGAVAGDTVNYTLSRAEGEDAGEYAITVTPGDNPNYDVTTNSGVLTITAVIAYLDAAWNAETKTVDFTEKPCKDYTLVTSGLTAWGAGWYVVNSNVTISDRVTVTGEVNLILCDGATLTASKGITVENSNQLTVYAQSGGTGTLIATASGNEEAGIGAYHSNNGSSNCGTVTIKGGVIEARGNNGAGIGGAGGNSGGGNVTIYGGSVTAIGQAMNTGIGSGWRPYGSTSVTIYGGEINATGGQRAAGIGGGTSASNITVAIYGGVINATGGSQNSAGIGYGDDSSGRHIIVAIHGGDVTAFGVLAIGTHSTNETTALTIADSLTVKAGNDVSSAVKVSTSDFIASHTQKYAHIFTAHTHDDDDIIFEPWSASDSLPTVAGDYYLTKDVTLSSTWNVPSGETNLCLNGHIIAVNYTDSPAIQVDSATLNLYDCGTETHYYTITDGLAVIGSGENSFTGGYITGVNWENASDYSCGAVVVDGGKFVMNGGSIIGNQSNANTAGVFIDPYDYQDSTFIMNGGNIIGNKTAIGGGVYVYNNGVFYMNGGSIRHNSSDGGGGVFAHGRVYMNGGSISDNTAAWASGICGGTIHISGGTIANNIGLSDAPGVSGTITLSGNPVISGNKTQDGVIKNVNVSSDNAIAIDGALSNETPIGVTMQTPGVFTSGLSGKGAASNFTSDSADYVVKLNDSGEAALLAMSTLDTAPAAVENLTYNATAQALVTAGAATGGTVQYKVGDSGAYSATIPTATDAGTYTVYYKVVGDDTHADTEEASISVTIAKAALTVTAEAKSKTYGDADPTLTYTTDGLVNGDTISGALTRDAGEDVGTYAISQGTLSAGDNYAISFTGADFTISKKPVTVSGITAANKPYDGNTNATLNYDNVTFNGIITGDALTVTATGIFDSADVGDGKTVTISGLTLSGADVDNYQLAETGQQSETTANVTANELNVTAQSYSGTYDGQAHSITVTAPEGVTVTYSETESGTYGTENPSYTDAESYTVYYKATKIGANAVTGSATVTISKKPVTVSGITAANKPYDGNTDATLNYDNVTFNGIVSGDTLTVTATGTFDSADIGDGKTVTISGLTLSGADADNYQLAKTGQQSETTANVTANELNVTAQSYSGVYDGKAHSISVDVPEDVTVTYSQTESGTYGDNPSYKDAGSYTVYYKATKIGANAVTGSATVTISKKPVTVSGITADDKPYDGNTDATLNYDNVTFNGIIAGDTLTVTATGTFDSADVGDGKTVTINGLTLSGADVANYELAETGQQSATTANITANELNVTAQGYSGVYDGEAHSISVDAPEDVTVTYSETESGTYGDNPSYKDAGSYTVYYKATKIGANAVTSSATVTISKKPVTVSGITAANKPYDGNTDATLNYDNVTFNGIIAGDTLTVTATGTFDSADVSDGKTVTISGLTLSGANVANYELAETGQQSATTANITANELNVTARGYSGTYDGQSHSITVTAPDGAVINYSDSKDGLYSEASPTYTDAGEYVVYYQVTLTGAAPVSGQAAVSIAKKTVSLTWDETSFIYDGAEKLPTVTVSGLLDGDTCGVTVTGGQTDAGTYTATAESLSNDNYQLPEQNTVSFTISEGTLEVVAEDYNGVYDGESHSITLTTPDKVFVSYSESADGDYQVKNPAYRDAGSYTVYYKVERDGYSTVRGSATVTITKREVTVSGIRAGDKAWNGDTDAALIFTDVVFDNILDGDKLTLSATGEFEDAETGNGKNVVITNLALGGADAGNYQLSEAGQQETTKASITPNPLDVTAQGYSGVYDGDAHGVIVTAPDGATVIYSKTEDGDYYADSPEYADAGNYAVFYRVEQEGSEIVTGSVSVNIARREVRVDGITAESKPYDGNTNVTFHYDNVTFDGLLTGDELSVSAAGAFEDAETGTEKTVTITELTLGGFSAGNYVLAEAGQQATTTADITALTLDISAEDWNGVYDGQSHSIVVTVPEDAVITYSETENGTYGAENPSYTDAGSYTVYYKATKIGANAVTGSATVTISKKPVTVSGITADDKPYDGTTEAALDYSNVTIDGIIEGDALTVTAAGRFEDAEPGDGKTVTISALTLDGADADNYQLSETGQQSETAANITANALNVTARGYSGVYDGEAHSISVTAPDGVTVTYSETENGTYGAENPAYRNAGNYTVYYRVTRTGAETVTGTRSVIIEKRAVTVSGITADDKPYDGNTSATLNYNNVTFDGIITGDALTVTATGRFEDAEPGDGKTVTISGLTLRGADAENYRLADRGQQSETAANITASALNVSVKGYSGSYDAKPHSITVTAPEGAVITYSETESGVYSTEKPSYTDAGEYTVYYKVTLANHDDALGHETVSISRASIRLRLSLVDRADPGRTKDSWEYGGIPAVPMLTVEFSETAETLAVLLGDGDAIRDYGLTSYSYKIRGAEAFISSTPEEIAVLPAGAYTMRVEIAESRNLPAASADADFTITKAAHENVLTEAVTLAHGLQNAHVDLSAYLEDGFSCAISGISGDLIAGAATLDGSAVLFDVSGEAGTLSGSVSVSVSSVNYLDYTVTVPLMTGTAFKLRFDSNGGNPVTETRTLNAGSAYGALPVPAREGYLFDGWHTVKTGGEAVTPETICNSDATLFAHWTAEQYTVTLLLEGGDLPDASGIWSGSGDTRAATFPSDGGAVTLPEAVRDGYVFTGWTADNALSRLKVSIPNGNTDNLTYKANWAEGTRSGYASFTKEEGGDSGFLGVQGLTQDTSKNNTQTGGTDNGAKSDIVKALQELACDDDTALASNQKKDVSLSMDVRVLTDATANDNETIRQERQDIADASKEIYGGDPTAKLDYLSIDIEKTVSLTTTEDDGTENVTPGVPVKVTEAHRVIEIPLRYDLTGRYSPVVIRCHGGEATTFRRIAERPAVFDGLDGTYYVSGAGNDTVIYIYSSRFSSYAVTTSGRESYTVFFDADGGTEIAPQIVYMDEGGYARKPADPVKDGYLFRGWRAEKNGSRREFDFDADIIRIDTILYAAWEKITEPEPEPVPHISSGGSSTPGLKEYVTAEGYRGVYNGAAHGIRVSAPQESTILYGLEKDGVYTEENPVFRDAGTYTVWYQVSGGTYPTVRDSRQVEIQRREVTVSGITANHKPYDGTTVATLNNSRVKFKGIVSGDELTITAAGTFDNAEVGDNKTVTISGLTLGGADAGNYRLAETGQQSETKANITPNDLQVTATGFSGAYDGNAHGISVDAPDGVSVTYSESENGAYHSENPAYVDAGYYIVYYSAQRADGVTVTGSAAVEITRRPVTVSGIRANNKPYDESAYAELIYDNVIISGVVTGDRLSVVADGTFEDAEIGDEKPVFITNLALRGENVGNYRLASEGQQTETKANITPNMLEVKAEAYVDVYDGEFHSIRVEAPEGAAVTYSEQENGTFGETMPVYRDAGQYTVYYRAEKRGYEPASGSETVMIYKRPVTLSGISAADKPYDGNTNVSLILSGAALQGQIPGDDITFTVSGAFENPEPGTDKTVFITGLTLRGAGAHNYWIPTGEQQTQTQADITPNLLQVSAEGYTGVYDGQSHGITVDAPDGTQIQYAESEGGTYRATAPVYRDAGEYTVYYRATKEGAPAVTGSAAVSIAKREVTVSGITADDKLYDQNTSVTLNYDNAIIIGIIPGDKLTVTAKGAFESADEGENKTVRLTGLTLGGADVRNYRLAADGQQSSAKASIIRKSYALTGTIRHADAEGAVTLELLDGDTVSASASTTMTQGVGTYSFQHVKAGSYTLVVTREDGAQTVKLTMPLKVGG